MASLLGYVGTNLRNVGSIINCMVALPERLWPAYWSMMVQILGMWDPGFSLAHKNVHFDPSWSPLTPNIIQKGDNDVAQNSQIELFLHVTVPQILNCIARMSLRHYQ